MCFAIASSVVVVVSVAVDITVVAIKFAAESASVGRGLGGNDRAIDS